MRRGKENKEQSLMDKMRRREGKKGERDENKRKGRYMEGGGGGR